MASPWYFPIVPDYITRWPLPGIFLVPDYITKWPLPCSFLVPDYTTRWPFPGIFLVTEYTVRWPVLLFSPSLPCLVVTSSGFGCDRQPGAGCQAAVILFHNHQFGGIHRLIAVANYVRLQNPPTQFGCRHARGTAAFQMQIFAPPDTGRSEDEDLLGGIYSKISINKRRHLGSSLSCNANYILLLLCW